MNIITVDFETYYDKVYGLGKLTTEEYIRGDQFEVIGVSVKVNNGPTEWASGTHEQLKDYLHTFDWADAACLAHNTMFDGAILSWIFDVHPKVWLDTLSMARALHGVEVGGSLKALAERYKIGVKGTEVVNALGKHRADFTDEELSAYGDYCINDVELTYKLMTILSKDFPKKELKLIDMTLRMFTDPVLELDEPLLTRHLANIQEEKEALRLVAGVDKSRLMSNPQFADLLREHGVEPPMKISPTTGKPTYAFAKTDEGLLALQDHPKVAVQALVGARLGIKGTLEETRTQRFIEMAPRGLMPVPLLYYGAHTGRWSGAGGAINIQNLPSRGPNAKQLKRSMMAPEGYVIIDADSAQIEARVLAWLAGQNDLVEAFATGQDVYSRMAATIYRKELADVTKEERFVGKTTILGCFGPDTKVLTSYGWKRIVEVQATDMVWDGAEWVNHEGVIPQGEKEVMTRHGVTATLDHEILTEHGWQEWSEVATNPTLFQSAINSGRLKSSVGNNIPKSLGALLGGTQWCGALVGGRGGLIGITSKLAAPCKQRLMTYDIAYAGPRNRFTILTNDGPVIAHNCGYGMGALRFQEQLATFGVIMDLDECRRIINIYRTVNSDIVALWRQAQTVIECLYKKQTTRVGRPGVLEVVPSERGVRLPSSLLLRYDGLKPHRGDKGTEYSYDTRRGRTRIYGGKAVENWTQAIARCIIGEQALKISKQHRVALTVHDSLACVVPKTDAVEAKAYIEQCMRWVPDWAEGLPVDCEAFCAERYGDCYEHSEELFI